MKKTLTLLLIISFQHLFSQVKVSETYFVYINYPDYTVKTCVDNRDKKLEINRNRTYYWYASNKIQETMGGADGKVLHGQYTSYYLNGNLKEKGVLKNGLKNGEWAKWYDNGKLKELSNWKKGVQCGTLSSYDINGTISSTSHYKKGKVNGYYNTYKSGLLTEKRKFKNGNEIAVKEKKEKKQTLKKWFKKKDKNLTDSSIDATGELEKENNKRKGNKGNKENKEKKEKRTVKQKQPVIANFLKYFKTKKENSRKKESNNKKKIKESNNKEEKNKKNKEIEFPIKKGKND